MSRHRVAVSWLAIAMATVLSVDGAAAASGASGAIGEGIVGIQVQPDPAAAEVSEEMLHAMRRDLKLTTQQARARLVRSCSGPV